MHPLRKQAFTLLELAIVLLIIGLVTAMAMTSGVAVLSTMRRAATEQKIQAIETALQSYRELYDRLPCPANLTIAEGVANFGVEAATPGTCYGGTPSANVFGLGEINTTRTGVEGTIPVVTLGLPNDYMYDGWGNRFRYAVDRVFTANNAFTTLTSGCNNFAITIKDALGNNRSTGAIYALFSQGENAHGVYTKQGVQVSSSSSNTDELINCHCSSTIAATAYAPTYVQKDMTTDPSNIYNNFDDIVVYKERWQMLTTTEKPLACHYILTTDASRVQKFDMGGNYLSQFGTSGAGNSQFSSPLGIAIDSTGNIWVVDSANNRMQKFDKNGTYITQTAGGLLTTPQQVAVDSSNNIWVSDYGNNRIRKFDSNAALIQTIGGTAASSADGLFTTPTGIAIDSSGNIWISDNGNNRIQKLNSSGVYQSKFGSAGTGNVQFQNNTGLAFDRNGNLYVVEYTGRRTQKIDTSGNFLLKFGDASSFGYLQTIAIDYSGDLWIPDHDNNRVQKFNSTGTLLSTFGSAGSGNGQFSHVRGIVFTRY